MGNQFSLVGLGIAIGSLALFPVWRILWQIMKYQVGKGKYSSLPHPHPFSFTPPLFRFFSDSGEVEKAIEEMREKGEGAEPGEKGQFYDVLHQGFGLDGMHTVGVTHPEDYKTILNDETSFKKDRTYQVIEQFLGKGLVSSTGHTWKTHRRVLTPAFHFQFLKNLFPIMAKEAQNMVKTLASKTSGNAAPEPVLAFEIFGKTALEILIKASLGGDLDSAKLARSFKEGSDAFDGYFKGDALFGPLVPYLPFGFSRNLRVKKAEISAILSKAVQKKREAMKANPDSSSPSSKGKDFVTLLLESEEISEEEIHDEMITFFFAGHDTTSSSLTWCMYFLAKYPEEQKRLQEELDEGGFDLNTITPEKLEGFPRLKMFFSEVLRMRPPVLALSRETTKEIDLRGQKIPKGTFVLLHFMATHFDPRFWEQPEEFRPDRFDPSEEESKSRHPYAYLPFSAGPRSCIGKRFAYQEAQVLLAALVSSFDISAKVDEVFVDGKSISRPLNYLVTFSPRKTKTL